MKKTLLTVALALVASATFNFAQADNRKKGKKAAQQTETAKPQPPQLLSGSDTLSYTAGQMLTVGLDEYLQQSYGIDSALMADFARGFTDATGSAADPKMKAYMAGVEIAGQVMQRMLPQMQKEFDGTRDTLVTSLVWRGFADAVLRDTTLFSVDEAEHLFTQLQQANRAEKENRLYGANRKAGEDFLSQNATAEGVVVTPSGLQYKVIVQGKGNVPQTTDEVKVHYEGRLVDGTVFDSSYSRGEPSTFRPDQVIAGWREALTMMPEGSKWQLFIPFNLAYGDRDMGQIKPFSALIFDVELISIENH